MPDKQDFLTVPAADALRVTSRNDSHQSQYEQQKRKKNQQQTPDDLTEHTPPIENLEATDLTEYGSLVLNKRNTELKLFVQVKNDSQTTDEELKRELEANTLLLHSKIAEYDKELQEYDLKTKPHQQATHSIELSLENISKLYALYQVFLECVRNEHSILNIDDIDFLDDIIRQKDDILNQIDQTRKEINFSLFTSLPEQNEKRIQAEQLLTDIHNIVSEIFKQEDENRVELQAVREKMKLEIARQDRGAKAISQFASPAVKSHFIDTKK